MTQTLIPPAASAEKPSRRGPLLRPTSRRRTALFLTVNFLAYAVANALLYYLSSGRWYDTSVDEYQAAIFQPLGQMLVTPLSIFAHPWMILVTGLLVAVVVVVPIVVTCLYHSRVCVFFLLCVAVLAHAPVLAIVLAAGCAAMAATTLRRRNPSLAMLLGLLPVFVYLYFATNDLPMVTQPMQRLLLRVPFLLAGVGAIVAGAAVLIVAHYTRYRPGVTWPVLVVLLAAPTWVFFSKVGGDELAYAVLASRLTPSDEVFADQTLDQWRSATRYRHEATFANIEAHLATRKTRRIAACERFLRKYPESRRRAAVLWMCGVTADTLVSAAAVEADPPVVSYYHSYPSPESETVWQRLRDEYGTDPRSAEACLRLAQIAIRTKRFDEAAELLAAGAAAVVEPPAPPVGDAEDAGAAREDPSPWAALFSPDPGRPSAAYLRNVCLEIDELRWLMVTNDIPRHQPSAEALAAWMALDRKKLGRENYNDELLALSERYTHSNLADNLRLALAMNHDDRLRRARALQDLASDSEKDASIEANYQLGLLALEAGSFPGLSRLVERPEVYFRLVRDAVKGNPWQLPAEQHLARLAAEEAARE